MQFNLYIFKQLLRSTLALVFVLVSVIWLFQTIGLLELIVNRGASADEFLYMSVAAVPLWLMIAVPISGFISVNWVFHRILSDRELLVMQSVGLSPLQLAKAPIALGVLLSSFLLVNSVYILPTSFGFYKDLQFKLRNSIPDILLRDGVFIEIVDGMTMFVGDRDDDEIMRDIFIHDARDSSRTVTMTAETGRFLTETAAPTLILQNGERSERTATGKNGAVLLFETHSLKIARDETAPTERDGVDMNEDSIANLLSRDANQAASYFPQRYAEGHYRMASPFLALTLCLLSSAILLRGQLRRDLWSRRAILNIWLCVLTIIAVVITRGMTTKNPSLWPLMHFSVLVPGVIGLLLLRLKGIRKNLVIA